MTKIKFLRNEKLNPGLIHRNVNVGNDVQARVYEFDVLENEYYLASANGALQTHMTENKIRELNPTLFED